MGSLFVIVVPIRSHELRLRLIENDLLNTIAVPVDAPDSNSQEAIFQTMKTAREHETSEPEVQEAEGIPAKDIHLPAAKQTVIAYTMNGQRGQLLLQITRDTMKLAQAQVAGAAVPEPEPAPKIRRGSVSSSSSGASLDNESILSFQGGGSRRGSSSQDTIDLGITELIDSQFLEKHVEDVLVEFSLLNASWETSIDGKFSRICFTVGESKADTIINHVHALGIGKKYESTLSVCATTVFTQEKPGQKKASASSTASETEIVQKETGKKWNSFVESIKARLTVAQVVQNVKANAVLTFDFIVMLIVAGILAALGLLESSSVNLIASMLVSPLMGPIMAFTFGAMIRDVSLIKTGAYVELMGLGLCLLVGFLFGIFLEMKPINGPWANVDIWPTKEMTARGQYTALIVGAAVAIPSGAGVALSILAGNAGSLVGVAISASLLPPCVNCGIFYGLALVISINEMGQGRNPFSVPCDMPIGEPGKPDPGLMLGQDPMYCKNSLREYAIKGTISLCLTLLNIVLIFFTGLIVLKIKEVAPYTTRNAFERFWKHDLKQARDYNRANMGQDTLFNDLAGDPKLLGQVEDDFVFNQIKNRAMYHDENVIATVKEKVSRAAVGGAQAAPPVDANAGWLSGVFSTKSKAPAAADVEANKNLAANAANKNPAQRQEGHKKTKRSHEPKPKQ